ncbi:hypothetical protein H6P81_005747 [Aristolochia fimbriata]|uniref:Uncharacterized protein n=1 Tax=Aristolochia fimbriata TaxID=158543 RepID=A0AAV7EVH7_ARIFI|nr:hypothetical protein H6P81_005747 [Aristolochia fimbriata]
MAAGQAGSGPAVEDSGPKSSPESDASIATYVGLSFAVFLGSLPRSYQSFISTLQSRNRSLSMKLYHAEEQLRQMKSRRKEDSKANARVVEIFASHRNGWQQEEKRLLLQIDSSAEEIVHLKTKIAELERSEAELRIVIEKLQRDVEERDEMINFLSRKADGEDLGTSSVETEKEMYVSQNRGRYCGNAEESVEFGDYSEDFSRVSKIRVSEGLDSVPELCFLDRSSEADDMSILYGQQNVYGRDYLQSSASKIWTERSSGWQDLQCEPPEPLYQGKHFVARRESPWKVDGESIGVSSKLKALEQELLSMEKIGNGELSKLPSMLRKQAKRYQSLSGKIDDLCRRMQVSDPCEPTLSSEFRTQRQTEFLLETFRLQQRAIETSQKLTALHVETAKSCWGDEPGGLAKVSIRRSLDSIKNNFKEIQRNLEIWLARIMGDLEGILARDGASRVRDYYISSLYDGPAAEQNDLAASTYRRVPASPLNKQTERKGEKGSSDSSPFSVVTSHSRLSSPVHHLSFSESIQSAVVACSSWCDFFSMPTGFGCYRTLVAVGHLA